jgi:uncharacterized membrane protein YphA (DoxX/SURF4 family)
MKKTNIIYWATTGLLFLFEGVMPALTSQSDLGKEGISHLGYPAYFGVMLAVFKVVGALVLILPQVPNRFKEWAYGCFLIEFIAAAWSHAAVDGLGVEAVFPLIFVGILGVSYYYFHEKESYKLPY